MDIPDGIGLTLEQLQYILEGFKELKAQFIEITQWDNIVKAFSRDQELLYFSFVQEFNKLGKEINLLLLFEPNDLVKGDIYKFFAENPLVIDDYIKILEIMERLISSEEVLHAREENDSEFTIREESFVTKRNFIYNIQLRYDIEGNFKLVLVPLSKIITLGET